MPNQPGLENRLEFPITCLDADEIASWNPVTWQIPNHVWM
jgi:hypothetical protein